MSLTELENQILGVHLRNILYVRLVGGLVGGLHIVRVVHFSVLVLEVREVCRCRKFNARQK